MKLLLVSLIAILTFVSHSIAGQGEPKGSVTIEMKQDESICITVNLENAQSETKCIEKGQNGYSEILNRVKGIKPGEFREVVPAPN